MNYFVTPINGGENIILEGDKGVTLPGWVPFTEEQEEFYKSHPDYEVWRIQSCTEIYEQPYDEYKESKVNDFKDYSEGLLNNKYASKVMDLLSSVVLNYKDSVYSQEDTRKIMVDYTTDKINANKILDTFVKRIESTKGKDSLDSLYESNISLLYDTINKKDSQK